MIKIITKINTHVYEDGIKDGKWGGGTRERDHKLDEVSVIKNFIEVHLKATCREEDWIWKR